jgi:hypothetical protein
MSRLSDLYKAMETLCKEGISINKNKKMKKVAFKVIDFRSFLTYIWRGI